MLRLATVSRSYAVPSTTTTSATTATLLLPTTTSTVVACVATPTAGALSSFHTMCSPVLGRDVSKLLQKARAENARPLPVTTNSSKGSSGVGTSGGQYSRQELESLRTEDDVLYAESTPWLLRYRDAVDWEWEDSASARKGRSRRRQCPLSRPGAPPVDYKNTALLSQFVNHGGVILSRRTTGVRAKHQRKLSRAIKRARHAGLIPVVTRLQDVERNRELEVRELRKTLKEAADEGHTFNVFVPQRRLLEDDDRRVRSTSGASAVVEAQYYPGEEETVAGDVGEGAGGGAKARKSRKRLKFQKKAKEREREARLGVAPRRKLGLEDASVESGEYSVDDDEVTDTEEYSDDGLRI